ncbi:hypothetical protein R1flu_014489 [Riccia fluitans]|uniref:Uncharacterized protein n=1 Tax=Riccia fluitans TaxID=41844 RepID=A0ABD1YGH6_9MARC
MRCDRKANSERLQGGLEKRVIRYSNSKTPRPSGISLNDGRLLLKNPDTCSRMEQKSNPEDGTVVEGCDIDRMRASVARDKIAFQRSEAEGGRERLNFFGGSMRREKIQKWNSRQSSLIQYCSRKMKRNQNEAERNT